MTKRAAPLLFRGTQTPDVARTRLGVTSWTPCLGAAICWSADPWGDPHFVDGSTVTAAKISAKKILSLGGPSSSFSELLEDLRYEKKNGITHDEAGQVLLYLSRRAAGRIKQPTFHYKVLDEDLESTLDERDVPWFSLTEVRTWLTEMHEDFVDGLPVAERVVVDTYAFADSAVVRSVATRLGYDAIRYNDTFAGAQRALQSLMNLEPDEVDCLSEEWDHLSDSGDWIWSHETLRPLSDKIIHIEWTQPGSIVAADYVKLVKESER